MKNNSIQEVEAVTQKKWRAWLQKNHKKESKVYLIKYKKHTGKPSLNNREAMEEAICFGWIDTTVKRLDDEKYQQCFMKRNKNSRWSNNTLRYAREMIEQGKMTPEGLKRYEEGLLKPVIDHGLPKDFESKELNEVLRKNKKAEVNFNKLAPSARRNYHIWIERAKRPETREKRVKEVVSRVMEGKRLGVN